MTIKTPKLDAVFGERLHGVTHNPTPTNWPRVEERIRCILDVMVEECGFMPTGQLRQSWISGAREFVENVGEDAEVARGAIRYMKEKELIIKSPRSLIAVALNMKHRGPERGSVESWRKYANEHPELFGH